MENSKCPKCGRLTVALRKREKPRKRDGATCTDRVCYSKGCGYSELVEATFPESVVQERKKQLTFNFV